MSLTASVVILVVWIARGFLWKAPKKYAYVLWLIVGIRLLCPVGIASPFSIYNFVDNEPIQIKQYKNAKQSIDRNYDNSSYDVSQNKNNDVSVASDDSAKNDMEIGKDNTAKTQGVSSSNYVKNKTSENITSEINLFIKIGSYVWVSVFIMIAIWNIYLMFRMKRKVSSAVRFKENIYECENIPAPFVMGLISPKIYIPFRLKEDEQSYIIRHEKYHIKRKDNVIKFIAFFICCVYWFHPLVWISYLLMVRDMEMSCDEYVLQKSPEDIRAAYSESLLGFALNKRNFGAGFLAFGESDTKRRVKHVMKFKGYGKWIGTLSVLLLIVVGVGCLTNTNKTEKSVNHEKTESNLKSKDNKTKTDNFWEDGNTFTAELTRYIDGSKVTKLCVVLVKEKAENKYDVTIRCDFNKKYDDINIGTFNVTKNNIIKDVDGEKEVVWSDKEVPDKISKDEKGKHKSIDIEDEMIKYAYYDNSVETGYYEQITFSKEKGLEEFVSGYGAERDLIQLEDLRINKDSIIELRNGVGTGTWYSTYFDVQNDIFSKAYDYAFAKYGDRIAYIKDFTKIAIVDLFSNEKERVYTLNFSDSILVPGEFITKAEFESRDELSVTYLYGEEYKEVTEKINTNMYTDEELEKMASDFYYQENHKRPPIVQVDSENEGVVTIHLYEINEKYGHTATWGWYYIDRATGKGKDFFDKYVDLTQVLSTTRIEDIEDKNILKVLKNEKAYYNTEFQKELYLKDYSSRNAANWYNEEGKCTYSNDSSEGDFKIEYWCQVDMDGDGNKEVILQSNFETQLVLHSEQNKVYLWAFLFREMKNIKEDGTFESSDNAAVTNVWKLKFVNGECYCQEMCIGDELEKGKEIYRINAKTSTRRKVKEYLEKHNQKETVEWVKY